MKFDVVMMICADASCSKMVPWHVWLGANVRYGSKGNSCTVTDAKGKIVADMTCWDDWDYCHIEDDSIIMQGTITHGPDLKEQYGQFVMRYPQIYG